MPPEDRHRKEQLQQESGTEIRQDGVQQIANVLPRAPQH